MPLVPHNRKKPLVFRLIASLISITFLTNSILPISLARAQTVLQPMLNLPPPGVMVAPSQGFVPTLINVLMLNPDDPLKFNFIIDNGHSKLQGEAFKKEALKLAKYFLATLTVPDNEMWVNLSPSDWVKWEGVFYNITDEIFKNSVDDLCKIW